MLPLRSVLVGQRDRDRIQALLRTMKSEQATLLFDEIDAATVVDDRELPNDVVKMHSRITFADLDSGEQSTVELVYPHELEKVQLGVSILAPVGAALIGLRVGESIEWPLPNGRRRRLEVIAVDES